MSKKYIDIAVGVLLRDDKVCLSRRQKHQSFADRWEFPGGKVEQGESIEAALLREFKEELAVETQAWQPLIEIPWDYGDLAVRLHVFTTQQFQGVPIGNEGQEVAWFSRGKLDELVFPEANQGIITALKLPDRYMITGSFNSNHDLFNKLESSLVKGQSLVQFRAKQLNSEKFSEAAKVLIDKTHLYSGAMLLNGEAGFLEQHPEADGLQLPSNLLFEYDKRPINEVKLLGASVHNTQEIQQALKIKADFLLLSPVKETKSHPGVPGIGWEKFAEMVKEIPVPVFALGGMTLEDVSVAKQNGAQGICAISGIWPST